MIYKKGTDNRVPDALSRKSAHDSDFAALTACTPQWIQEVVTGYQDDSHASSVLAKLMLDDQAVPKFSLHNGLLKYKGRIWIGDNKPLQLKLITACHSSAIGGHSGIPVTYSRIKQLFAWKGLKAAVASYVKSCTVCQQALCEIFPGLL